ncbi:ABC transporter ATP-binding protein [Lentibacillus sp. N15]|uniref:ABC transporter ATP-binding protein n=1 Tax=Lentibacillus songyuanensis TaxID=3136161 RepID=UPI0031B9EA65
MINMENVSQSFQKKTVLDQINLTVEKGERCALVGRNGAGKSTLIKTMLGILPYKQGKVDIAGYSNKKHAWKRFVSYLPEKFQLYPHLTGEENLRFFAEMNTKKADATEIQEKLKLVSLYEERNKQISEYSKGMLQRLGLAVILYYDSDVIILDEPTSGLDPIGRNQILRIVQKLEDKTVLMASHHVEEIKKVCSHVAFLEGGKVHKYTVDDFLIKKLGGEWE